MGEREGRRAKEAGKGTGKCAWFTTMCRLWWNAKPRQLGDQHPLQPGKCGPQKEAGAPLPRRNPNLSRPH